MTRGISPIAAIAGLILFSCCMPSANATEPDGRLAIRHEWVGEDGAPGPPSGPLPGESAVLRIYLRAPTGMRDMRVRLETVPGIEVRAVSVEGGALRKGESRILEWRVTAPALGGGILALRVDSLDQDAIPVSDGAGIPVGIPGVAPVSRHGALEFVRTHEDGEHP